MEVCQVVEVYNHSIMELEIVFDLNTKLFLIYLQKTYQYGLKIVIFNHMLPYTIMLF